MILDLVPIVNVETPAAMDFAIGIVNIGVGLAELFENKFTDEVDSWVSVWGMLCLFVGGYLVALAAL